MLARFFEPMIFNKIIMCFYSANIMWQAYGGRYADMSYWFFALGITATVTWGYPH